MSRYDARVRHLLAALGATVLVLTGCGGSDTDKMVRTGTAPIARKADGSLASNPAPMTMQDVRKQPEDSPQRTVMQLIFWAQWGNLPAIIDMYDPRVVTGIGTASITGGYDYLRPQLLNSLPRVVDARNSSGGRFISLELTGTSGGPAREGFLLRRRNGVWKVVYDTLLERAIEANTISELAPGDPSPSSRVMRSGVRAAERYRNRYPTLLRAWRSARRSVG